MKVLTKNRNFVFLSISFALEYGNSIALGAVVSSLTKPYGYHPSDNAIFGVTYIVAGVIGSVIIGILLDKYRKYKLTVQLLCVLSFIGFGLTFLSLPTG